MCPSSPILSYTVNVLGTTKAELPVTYASLILCRGVQISGLRQLLCHWRRWPHFLDASRPEIETMGEGWPQIFW